MRNYKEKLDENFHHFLELQKIMEYYGFPEGGGSYMMDGQTSEYCSLMFDKQELLFNTSINSDKILEVGVYAGHSCFIMLLANENSTIDAIDPGYPFTEPCVKYLNKNFNDRINYIPGLSHEELPKLSNGVYDLIHIDGMHDPEYIRNEMEICLSLKKDVCVLVVDDIHLAIQGMNIILPKLKLRSIPDCIYSNAVYDFI